jgi:3',5'-cyclic AMP phosphodiesterase CpdA
MAGAMQKIAVIADPHFHDIARRPGGHADARPAIRTLADTVESTRVFNESYAALPALLDDVVARGIGIAVVAGDLTDDGQAHTVDVATALLRDYSARHGLRFFATPGNHDLYAVHGRHQSKRFLNPDGTHTLVTSDATAPQGDSVARVVTEAMYCGGYESALRAMAPFGFFRDRRDLHWESPFGADDRLEARTFEIRSADGQTRRRMIDASYLVEPVPGLWLLSIDANVFEPRNGDLDPAMERSYIDSADAGWNSMLRNKPFIFDWMRDVVQRATEGGKQLLAFSHYPMLDTLGDTAEEEARLFGDTSFLRRTPGAAVARAVAETGIKVHFSGHLHVNDTAFFRDGGRFLVNISVPSMVAFPPAYKIVGHEGDRMCIETVTVADAPGFDAAFDLYRAEKGRTRVDHREIVDAASHADFLSRHVARVAAERHLPREWPKDLARLVPQLNLADLWRIADVPRPLAADEVTAGAMAPSVPGLAGIGFIDLVADWYRLRSARELALDVIPPQRLAAYDLVIDRYAAGAWDEGSIQGRIAGFLRILAGYLASYPSRDFVVDLVDGTITGVARDIGAESAVR